MTKEDRDLLLKDLCARLPYGVIVQQSAKYPKGHIMYNVADKWDTEPHDFKIIGVEGTNTLITDKRKEERTYAKGIVSSPITICIHNGFTGQVIKPYLRPMSSMTEEEREEYNVIYACRCREDSVRKFQELCYLKHFDCNDLIGHNLALEAPVGMYKL